MTNLVFEQWMRSTISITAITAIFWGISPFLSEKYSARTLYWVWKIILLGWLIPIRPVWLRVHAVVVGTETNHGANVWIGWGFPVVWGLGAIVIAGRSAFCQIRFSKFLHRWRGPAGEQWQMLLENEKKVVDIHRQIDLYSCEKLENPILMGWIRPTIYIPAKSYSPQQSRLILCHEWTHYKRGDSWWKLIKLMVLVMHWFNPAAWIMAHQLEWYCELSCDENVLRHGDDAERRCYGKLLLSSSLRQSRQIPPLSSTLTRGGENMKKRLTRLLDSQSKRNGKWIPSLILLLVLATGGIQVLAVEQQTDQELVVYFNSDGEEFVEVGNSDVTGLPEEAIHLLVVLQNLDK